MTPQSTLCRHCHDSGETFDHIFLRCDSLEDERKELRDALPDCVADFVQTALIDRRYSIPAQRFVALAFPHEDSEDAA